MRKTSTSSSKPDIDIDFVSGATDASEEGYQQVSLIKMCVDLLYKSHFTLDVRKPYTKILSCNIGWIFSFKFFSRLMSWLDKYLCIATWIKYSIQYFQVPTIIETSVLNGKKKDSVTTFTSKYEDYPMCNDAIDIKSYISHSRNDIGAFDYSPTPEPIKGGWLKFKLKHS